MRNFWLYASALYWHELIVGSIAVNCAYTYIFHMYLRRLQKRDQHNALKDLYKSYPPLFSIVRHDGQRCCCKFPCKLLSTFVCCNCCQDGMDVYVGSIQDPPDKERGRPVPGITNPKIGSVYQPRYGGCYRPLTYIHLAGQSEPFAKVEGPIFFGGWIELCCEFTFYTSYLNSETKKGDVALIKKSRPKSVALGIQTLFTDFSNFTIEFSEYSTLSAEQKTTVLAAQLLADYMFFDGNTEKCKNDDNAVYCYICYCLCLGALIPCEIIIPKNGN